MFTQELKSFMKMHNISSAAKWEKATNGEVSESTISRILNAKNKDIGLNTFLLMISPYGATPDEVLGLGAFSPEALEKAEIVGKLESVIERIETTEEIPPEETQEIKLALEEAQEHIASEPVSGATCGTCASLRETIADLTAENELKDKWISQLLRIVASTTGTKKQFRRLPARIKKPPARVEPEETTPFICRSRYTPNLKNGKNVCFDIGETVLYRTRGGTEYSVVIDSELMQNNEGYYGYEAIFPDGRFFIVDEGIIDWDGKVD